MLRVQRVEQVTPVSYTVLGWEVEDIGQSVTELVEKGVSFEHFPFLTQDKTAIWTTPDGVRVAWFEDPNGNMISITQDSNECHQPIHGSVLRLLGILIWLGRSYCRHLFPIPFKTLLALITI